MTVLKSLIQSHPRIAAFICLAVAMVIVLLIVARDVGLAPSQMAAMIVATIVLAGLCVWIIGWESSSPSS